MLPDSLLTRGPDILRGQGVAFIVTRYPDPSGRKWFVQPGTVGHEEMTDSPEMLQALFGPKWTEIADQVSESRPVYVDVGGKYAPSGKVKITYDYPLIRRLAKKDNLFGRAGHLDGKPVVMLWNPCENWQNMALEAVKKLNLDGDTIVTVGSSDQYLARDLHKIGRPKIDQNRLELLTKYHTATGAEKQQLAKQLGLHDAPTLRPGSAEAWRQAGRKAGEPYLHRYGEDNAS